ncbi:MAG: hypothetical protein ILP13_03555, partial [Lachnospiraceae bacterium]|nr:hypothetical protein [Lachnospiraceae bacterium]
ITIAFSETKSDLYQVAASLSSANRSPETSTGRFRIPNYVRDFMVVRWFSPFRKNKPIIGLLF